VQPVVFVQDVDVGGPGTPAYALPAAIAPAPGGLVFAKSACDAFHGTELEAGLGRLGTRTLVVCGMKSQFCIGTSVRRAVSLGFSVVLVADGHTTTDSHVLPAAAIIAHENATLDGFGTDRGEVVVTPAARVGF
jgi:nicotinamidase-related amidase